MSTRVQLFFSAVGLKDDDVLSKSDPYLVLFEVGSDGRRRQVGRTETVKNNLCPVWTARFEVDFRFEARQDFIAQLYDSDGKGPEGDDNLGIVQFPLAHVVSGRNGKVDKPVEAPGKGTLTISSEAVANVGNDQVTLSFFGTKLKKMDVIGKSDPYFKLFRVHPNGGKDLLYQSNFIDTTLDPRWEKCPPLLVSALTGADLDHKGLLFECYDKDVISDDEMGQFVVSFNELMRAAGQPASFVLRDPKKPSETFGTIGVSEATLAHFPTFPEFLAAGMNMNMAVAVDFTGSNGDPRNPQSLHYMNPAAPNQYVRAITSVCSIVLEYDTDKLVAAVGFGGKLPNGQVSHCFHLNAQPDPNVFGLQGILDAYGAALTHVQLSGPTNFAPTIRQAAQVAQQTAAGLIYQILLIITDGAITDTDATLDAIVAASELPLSIIIIGVGNADFSTMVMLDGDNNRITDRNGKPAARDIVQFVPFRDFAAGPMDLLAAEVLREVPRQVETWAAAFKITPAIIAQRRAAAQPPVAAAAPPPAAAVPPVPTKQVA